MAQTGREHWATRFGFIMAAAGSAVGLGNIWRFPYLTGANGGGAFIVIYIGCVVLVGLSIMIAEFAVGRRTQLAAVGAYKSQSRKWTFAGVLGVLSAFFIMGFYPVVGGWAMAYIVKSFTGLLSAPDAIGDAFGAFIGDPLQPIIWMLVYMAIHIVIVGRGVSKGIELAGKILMPLLYVLLIIVAVKGFTFPGSGKGLSYLFVPDWSAVTGKTFLAALGQAFFSLSLGMGCMITYGSYINKRERLPGNALIVVSMDNSVALLAGVALFPALFAFGMKPAAGPGLVFVVVPKLCAHMGGIGVFFSAIFFISLFIAALTSSVSLLEVCVAYLMDEKKWNRKTATNATILVMVALCILSSLSLGTISGVKLFGVGFFDFFDILTDKIFLAIGGMLLAIFVGWFNKKEDLKDELTNGGTVQFKLFELWYAVVKYVIPILIGLVAFFGIASIEQRSLMLFGLFIIAALAAVSKKL